MSNGGRYSSEIRARTKLLSALLGTPDDKLDVFLQSQTLTGGTDANRLILARDLLDAIGQGLQGQGEADFWRRLDGAWSALCGRGGAAAAEPAAPMPPVAIPPAVPAAAHAPEAPTPAAAPIPTREPAPGSATAPFPSPDFRHGMAQSAPQERQREAHAHAANTDWRPETPGVRTPAPGQAATEALSDGVTNDLRMDLKAAREAASWPLERFSELCVHLAAAGGPNAPAREQVATRFGLPSVQAMQNAIVLWQDRFDKDPELARQHASLVARFQQQGH